tara:strand:+ start:67 stop:447 length:381 start_codon:yes stop_codon:yes gene_type:complete
MNGRPGTVLFRVKLDIHGPIYDVLVPSTIPENTIVVRTLGTVPALVFVSRELTEVLILMPAFDVPAKSTSKPLDVMVAEVLPASGVRYHQSRPSTVVVLFAVSAPCVALVKSISIRSYQVADCPAL